jgi:hypothetical protein
LIYIVTWRALYLKMDYLMGKAPLFLLIISYILIGSLCYSQTSVKVSDPRLEMVGNTIHISYDILNSDPDEKYIISVAIKDEDGYAINARALDGDIGEAVSGGSNKQITWNLEADNIFLDAFVFVQVNAKVIPPPEPVVVTPAGEPKEEVLQQKQEVLDDAQESNQPVSNQAVSRKEPPAGTGSKSYNRAGLVIQSLAIPGLGLSRVTGKPHWLRGVAGYGCIAGSVILNRQAINTYNGIEDLVYFDEINEAYDKSLMQDNISEILSYAAIGIWAADFIWTLVGTSDLNRPSYSSRSRGLSMGSNINPVSNAPLISIIYRF